MHSQPLARRHPARRRPPRLLALVVAAAAVGALGTAGCRSARDERVDPSTRPLRRVTPPVAFEMLRDAPYLALVDVRPAEEFHGPLGHLNGARNLPLAELRERYRELLDLKDRTFLLYCRRDECNAEAMEFLLSHGFPDVVLIDGGIEAWIADGFGTVGRSTGDPPSADHRHERAAGGSRAGEVFVTSPPD